MDKIIKIFSIILVSLLLFSCRLTNTDEENKEIDNIKNESVDYLSKKYNKKFKYIKSDYVYDVGIEFSNKDSNRIIVKYDEVSVIYNKENKTFYDNYQSNLIEDDILNKIINPFIEKHNNKKIINTNDTGNISDNNYAISFYTLAGKGYYNNYYDNDIDKFLKKENVYFKIGYYSKESFDNGFSYSLGKSNQLCFQTDNIKYNDEYNEFKEIINNYFNNENQKTEIVFSKYCENKEYNIGMDEVIAIGNKNDILVQNYIKLEDGIYITSNSYGIKLEENDLKFNKLKDKNKFEKDHNIELITPIYKLVVSDRIKSQIDNNTHFYIKLENEKFQKYSNFVLMKYDESNDKLYNSSFLGEYLINTTLDDNMLYFIKK